MRSNTLPRHGLTARALHFANALVVIVLLLTGLVLGGVLPEGGAALIGGHLGDNATHRILGLAFAIALAVLAVALPRRVGHLLHDIGRFQKRDWLWSPRFLAYYFSRRRNRAPFHDGRFDPAQRIVFAILIASLTVATASGVYLYFWNPTFPLGQQALGYAIRVHITASWVLIVCVCLHIIAGSGLLRTHRGLVTAMFGNGRVSLALARTLWPGWADRSAPKPAQDPATSSAGVKPIK